MDLLSIVGSGGVTAGRAIQVVHRCGVRVPEASCFGNGTYPAACDRLTTMGAIRGFGIVATTCDVADMETERERGGVSVSFTSVVVAADGSTVVAKNNPAPTIPTEVTHPVGSSRAAWYRARAAMNAASLPPRSGCALAMAARRVDGSGRAGSSLIVGGVR